MEPDWRYAEVEQLDTVPYSAVKGMKMIQKGKGFSVDLLVGP